MLHGVELPFLEAIYMKSWRFPLSDTMTFLVSFGLAQVVYRKYSQIYSRGREKVIMSELPKTAGGAT